VPFPCNAYAADTTLSVYLNRSAVVSLKMVVGIDQASSYLDLDEGRMGLDTKELIFTSWKNKGIFNY
jgi:hypothetical protein